MQISTNCESGLDFFKDMENPTSCVSVLVEQTAWLHLTM